MALQRLRRGIATNALSSKLVVVEVLMFTEENAEEMQVFIGSAGEAHNGSGFVKLNTRFGTLYAEAGCWVVQVAPGRFQVYDPLCFDGMFEPV